MYAEQIEKELKAKKIKVGESIKVSSAKGTFEGVLIPRPEVGDESVLVIKLESGYNIGIRFEDGTKIARSEAKIRDHPAADIKINVNPKLPKVTVIGTGGTIQSRVDYETGGVQASGIRLVARKGDLLYDVPELAKFANFSFESPMSIMSEDMTHKEWGMIAIAVAKTLNQGARGVVIMHGTDTLHYTSAALSFMLQELNAPVVLVGAQRSPDRGSSDAFMNLTCATHIAASSDIAEVGVCMHTTSSDETCDFIRGTKVRKMHTSRRDAFKPINNRAVVMVDRKGEFNYVSSYKKINPTQKGEVIAVSGFEPKVALIKVVPGSDPKILDFYLKEGYKGIILEGTGLGHTPIRWIEPIKKLVDSGIIVGMTSQTIYGRVNANVYSTLRKLSAAGVIYCEDMLPEVAYIKLGFLLGNYTKEETEKMLPVNMVGEITNRTEVDYFM